MPPDHRGRLNDRPWHTATPPNDEPGPPTERDPVTIGMKQVDAEAFYPLRSWLRWTWPFQLLLDVGIVALIAVADCLARQAKKRN
jgi:hypothetical protein